MDREQMVGCLAMLVVYSLICIIAVSGGIVTSYIANIVLGFAESTKDVVSMGMAIGSAIYTLCVCIKLLMETRND